MITFDLDTIYGIGLGIQFADQEVKNAVSGLRWGLSVELLIIRISINYWDKE